ncbi:MAG TPA: hypothetical protein VFR02_06290 [bacterium]|nr:hypothetical protein [bacterium]
MSLVWIFLCPAARAQFASVPNDGFLTPGGSDDRGAVAEGARSFSLEEGGWNSLQGLLASQVGWAGTGLRAIAPGLLFEGVAYPLDDGRILGWAPAWGRVELLDFPAQAWWGPSAAAGAVQWRAPAFTDDPRAGFTAGGGTGGFGEVEGDYSTTGLGLSAGYRRAPGSPFTAGPLDAGGLQASARIPGTGDWGLGGSFLAVGDGAGDDWIVGLGDLRWTDGNFQRLRLRPYAQSARSDGGEVREAGADLDYDLDLAGIAEANLAGGVSRREGPGARTAGFLQDSELLDALGDLTLDGAFRLDWTGDGSALFSTVLGAQMAVGDMLLRADEATAQDPADPGRPVEQAELGLRPRGDDKSFDLAYRHLSTSQAVLNGVALGAGRDLDFLEGPVLGQASVGVQLQYLVDTAGTGRADFGAWADGFWFGALRTRVLARRTGDGPLFGSARVSCRLDPRSEVFLEGQNLGGLPQAWPEPDWRPGLDILGGVHLDL